MSSCKEGEEHSFIINLSEDATIDTIVISNYEEFSDNPKEIELKGSIDYPPEKWV